MPAALQTDEFRDVIEILAEDKLLAFGEHRHRLHSEFQQLILPAGVVQNIDRNEFDAFLRKKLFRSQATASTRLGEQHKLIGVVFHNILPPSSLIQYQPIHPPDQER